MTIHTVMTKIDNNENVSLPRNVNESEDLKDDEQDEYTHRINDMSSEVQQIEVKHGRPTGTTRWDLDEILTDLTFGWYQMKNLCLIGFILLFANIFPLSFTLTAGDMEYRCYIQGCDNSTHPKYSEPWLPNAIPHRHSRPRKCQRYSFRVPKINNQCEYDNFDRRNIEWCDKWVFATQERTIVNDFNLKCEHNKWKLTLVGSLNNLAQFFGIPIFGIVSDKYGRKPVVIWCSVLSAMFGIARGFSTNYITFLVSEFLDSFFGSATYGIAFIMAIELVTPMFRPLAVVMIEVFYPMGAVIMGSVAWYLQDWRKLLISCYAPGLLFVCYFWCIPESVRWQLTNGRKEEVVKTLKNIAKVNKAPLPQEVYEIQNPCKANDMHPKRRGESMTFSKSLSEVLHSRRLFFRLINCSFAWFTAVLVYHGLSINSVELVGNKYLNFIMANAIEAPAFILGGFILHVFKRRVSLSGSFILSGIACVASEFVPAGMSSLQIAIYLVGKFLITISFNLLYIYSAEMFPTELRLSLCGFASMFGRIGSMIAPQAILLREIFGEFGEHAPVLIFGATSMMAGFLATSFPETFHKKLYDTVVESIVD